MVAIVIVKLALPCIIYIGQAAVVYGYTTLPLMPYRHHYKPYQEASQQPD